MSEDDAEIRLAQRLYAEFSPLTEHGDKVIMYSNDAGKLAEIIAEFVAGAITKASIANIMKPDVGGKATSDFDTARKVVWDSLQTVREAALIETIRPTMSDELIERLWATGHPRNQKMAPSRLLYRKAAAALIAAKEENDRLRKALAFADEHAAKIEALLEPHIKWDDDPEALAPPQTDRRGP